MFKVAAGAKQRFQFHPDITVNNSLTYQPLTDLTQLQVTQTEI